MKQISERFREQLICLGIHLGLKPEEADDIAQEALIATVEGEPELLKAYAKQAVRNLVRKKFRDEGRQARKLREEPIPWLEEVTPILLEDPEKMVSVDAALEQFVVWGHWGGNTQRIIDSLLDVDTSEVLADLRVYYKIINALPFSERHKRRLREQFVDGIRRAMQEKAFVYRSKREADIRRRTISERVITKDDPIFSAFAGATIRTLRPREDEELPEAEPIPMQRSPKPMPPEPNDSDEAKSEEADILFIMDTKVSRGLFLARRLAPGMELEDALKIVCEIVLEEYERMAQQTALNDESDT